MIRTIPFLFLAAVAVNGLSACSTAPETTEERSELIAEADAALAMARNSDPTIDKFLRESRGYAVFPKIGKGAAGVGGAYGRGVLYQGGEPVGYCEVTQASVGLQLGGQTFTEVVCFHSDDELRKFKEGNLEFDAQASAVAIESGTGAKADFDDEVTVFVLNEKGLMVETSVGGQKFDFEAL